MRFPALGLLLVSAAFAQDGEERLDPSMSLPKRPDSIRVAPPIVVPTPPLATDTAKIVTPLATPDSSQAKDSLPQASAVGPTIDTVPAIILPAKAMAAPASADTLRAPATPAPTAPATPRAAVVIGLDTSTQAGRKSVWIATGLTLLLPGAGEQYLGATTRAKVFFATELVSVAAAWLSWRNREDALISAREIASRYAGADAQNKPIEFLELMGQYRSRRPVGTRHDSYDEAMLLSGQATDRQFANTDSYVWDWGSTENPENDAHLRTFESQLRTYRASKVALSFSLGAMGVSRILSLADVLWLHRRASWLQAEVTPLPQGAAGRLAWRF
jgi:hypothetical protein